MTTGRIVALLGAAVIAAGLAGGGARANPITSIVTPATSAVFAGSSVQTIDLAQVYTPAGSYWTWNGLNQCSCGRGFYGYLITPYTPLVMRSSVPTTGGTLGTLSATYDPATFAYGVTNIEMQLQWIHSEDYFGGTVSTFTYTTAVARVARMFDLPIVNLVTPLRVTDGLFGFRLKGKPGAVTTLDATIAWGDGTSSVEPLAVVGGVVSLSRDLHEYDRPGQYMVTLSYMLDGQQYGLTTTIAVPSPPAWLLLLTGMAGLLGTRRPNMAAKHAKQP